MPNSSTAKRVAQEICQSLFQHYGRFASVHSVSSIILKQVEDILDDATKISGEVSVTVTPVTEKPGLQEVFDAVNCFTQTTRVTINVRVWKNATARLQEDFKRLGLYDAIDWTKE